MNNLECPYDLSDKKQYFLWQIKLKKHWYIEAFKISYPKLYILLCYINTFFSIKIGEFKVLFYKYIK